MSILYRLSILGLLMTALQSPAWAALPGPVSLAVGQHVSLEGLTLTVSSCTATGSGSCANVELLPMSASRGAITFEVVGDGGTVGNSTLSAALSDTSRTTNNTLSFVLAVSDAAGSTRTVTDVSVSTTGTDNLGTCHIASCPTASIATGAASINVAATPSTSLLDTLTQSTTQQTQSAGPITLSTATGSFNLTQTLTLNAENFNVNTFNIFSQLITFHPAPEPATFSIMMLGLGGLALARRRQRGT